MGSELGAGPPRETSFAAPPRRATAAGASRYQAWLDDIGAQLDEQRSSIAASAAVVMVPAVGFGSQATGVLGRTLRVLANQECAGRAVSVVVLVNRPAGEQADGTLAIVEQAIAGGAANVAVASVALTAKPRLGELRQLLADAVAPLVAPGALAVVCDDDIRSMQAGCIDEMRSAVAPAGRAHLAIGPVLFDDEHGSAALLPEFHVGDILRALLSARWLSRLARLDPRSRTDIAMARWLAADYFEAIVLSCHLGVTLQALRAVGGFRDLNEITNLARDVQGWRLGGDRPRAPIAALWEPDAASDPYGELLARAVRVSPRRAMHALARGHGASVEQWRACRLRTSRVDPVRVVRPPLEPTVVAQLSAGERGMLARRIEHVVATTLSYFPPDEVIVRACLDDAGLVSTSAVHDGSRWSVSVGASARLFDALHDRQARAYRAYEAGGSLRSTAATS